MCIYPKDVQCITGKSYRQSARLLQKMKSDLNKSQNHFISIEEFCNETGLQFEDVVKYIAD